MHRSALLPLLLTAALGTAPAAGAQTPPGVPADAPVVAGPTPAGATLVAFDRGGRTCVAARGPAVGLGVAPLCLDRAPLRLDRFDGLDTISGGGNRLFGVTAPGVASVDVVGAGGAAASAPVQDGAGYRGRLAGRLGFWIMDAAAGAGRFDSWRLVRWRDAAGAVVSAAASPFAASPPVRPAVTVATGGAAGGGRWRVRAVTRRVLRPSAAQPERYEDETCLSVTSSGAGRSDFEGSCETPSFAAGLTPLTTTICGATLAGGFTPAATVRVVVRGTDGSRRSVATRPVDGLAAERRAFATGLPAGAGVRSMVELGADGRRRATVELGVPPERTSCRQSDFGVSGAIIISTRDVVATVSDGASPPPLVAGDRGDLLCVDLGALRPDGADCSPFEPTSFVPGTVLDGTSAAGTVIAGVTLPEVAAVEVTTTARQRLTVPTTDDIGYTGPYRGRVRFYSVTVGGGGRPAWVRFLDASGATLGYGQSADPPFARAPVARAHAGSVTLSAGAVWRQRRTAPCLALTPGRPPQDTASCEGLVSRHEAIVRAFCAVPGLAVAGLATAGVRRAQIVLGDGRRRALRLVAVPGAGRAYFGVTRPGEGLRGILLSGSRRELLHATPALPPARAQCGYATQLFGAAAFRQRPLRSARATRSSPSPR